MKIINLISCKQQAEQKEEYNQKANHLSLYHNNLNLLSLRKTSKEVDLYLGIKYVISYVQVYIHGNNFLIKRTFLLENI